MGCTGCSTGGDTPRGCQNNGTCSSGGCNKLGVFDWLANMQLPSNQAPYDIVEIRFKNSRKGFYKNSKNFALHVGDVVVVEAAPGFDVGVVSVVGELARIQVKRKADTFKMSEVKKIFRIANQEDINKWIAARELEKEVMYQSRTLAVNLKLEMKISDVEYQGDLTKATFYYTAEGRVDFRQLIKDMADKFKIRVEMRQIGSRQEASRLGGIGSCGRELCCSTWLTDFRSVSTAAARYQQLSLNPQKLAGQCGKLKCCLNYELDMYLDTLKQFPSTDTKLYTKKGMAYHVKTDVFKKLMWYAYEGQSGLIALAPSTVKDIAEQNSKSQKPDDLNRFAFEVSTVAIAEPDYSNVVGQDSLDRFDNNFKKQNNRKKKPVAGKRPVAGTENRRPTEGGEVKADTRRRAPQKNQNRPKDATPGAPRDAKPREPREPRDAQAREGQVRTPREPQNREGQNKEGQNREGQNRAPREGQARDAQKRGGQNREQGAQAKEGQTREAKDATPKEGQAAKPKRRNNNRKPNKPNSSNTTPE